MYMMMAWWIQFVTQISIARKSVHLLIYSYPFVSYPFISIDNWTTHVVHFVINIHGGGLKKIHIFKN